MAQPKLRVHIEKPTLSVLSPRVKGDRAGPESLDKEDTVIAFLGFRERNEI